MEQLPMILDGIILAILLGFAIIGYRTGFIMAALGFVPIMFACIGVRRHRPRPFASGNIFR